MADTATADSGVSAQEAQTAVTTNDTVEQKTTVGGKRVKAEGQVIRDEVKGGSVSRQVKSLADITTVGGVKYDETGRLVSEEDGTPLAATADAYDTTVGWTAQHAGAHQDEKDRRPFPLEAGYGLPDQTYSTDELPDPLVALKSGLLPQNVEGLRIDEDKHAKKKSLEA